MNNGQTPTDLFGEIARTMIAGAEFSTDRKYRYALWRIWDKSKPLVMFIGLNPSTANETEPDPTIRRVINFARDWGYGGFYMMNLFAIVSSKPEVLLTDPDPMGNNYKWLENISEKCDRVVFAWGAFKEAKVRAEEVKSQFPDAYCLKKTKDGHPWHPLYVAANTQPILFI
jgi:hypothetical protein